MITIKTMDDIKNAKRIFGELRDELEKYFKEVAEGLTGEEDAWNTYSLEEDGPIFVLEEGDNPERLKDYGICPGSSEILGVTPEFASRIDIGNSKYFRIVTICNNSYAVSIYCPIGVFGGEFDRWIEEFVVD